MTITPEYFTETPPPPVTIYRIPDPLTADDAHALHDILTAAGIRHAVHTRWEKDGQPGTHTIDAAIGASHAYTTILEPGGALITDPRTGWTYANATRLAHLLTTHHPATPEAPDQPHPPGHTAVDVRGGRCGRALGEFGGVMLRCSLEPLHGGECDSPLLSGVRAASGIVEVGGRFAASLGYAPARRGKESWSAHTDDGYASMLTATGPTLQAVLDKVLAAAGVEAPAAGTDGGAP